MDPQSHDSLEHRRLGHYLLLGRIGSGGMGAIYEAEMRGTNRHVAVKVLPEELAEDESYLKRFFLEARAMARIYHPNIARVLEVSEERGLKFIALELVDGGSLADPGLRVTVPGTFTSELLRFES